MKAFLLALQFLTIIPVRLKGVVTERDVGRSASFFPLVGAFQGLIAGAAAFALSPLFPIEIVAGLIVLLLILLNGGFHLDGLADTFDAIAVKSAGNAGLDRARRLSVMKDSATGAIGVVSIVMSILLKYLLLGALLGRYLTPSSVYVLLLMPVFSKWVMTVVLVHGTSARKEGLGKVFVDQAGAWTTLTSGGLLVAVLAAETFLSSLLDICSATKFFVLVLVCLYAFGVLWAAFCKRRFGGSTGDTVGAAAEIADLLFLMIAFAWLE